MRGMFGSRKFASKSNEMLRLCQSVVVTSFEDLAPRSELIMSLEANGQLPRWDIFMTIAAVGVAIAPARAHLNEKQFRGFHAGLMQQLASWYEPAPAMLDHLFKFIVDRHEMGDNREFAVGAWVLSNLKGDMPTDEELAPAQAIGDYLNDSLEHWWDQAR